MSKQGGAASSVHTRRSKGGRSRLKLDSELIEY